MEVVRALVYLTCFCFTRVDLVFCDDYGESGGQITLTPSIRDKPMEILWKHNGDKVVEYDNRDMETYGSFKERVVIDFETGQLTIMKLTSQDSGQYQAEILINGQVQQSSHSLTVLDVLPDPRVTCEPNKTLVKLLCSVEAQTQVDYRWSGPDVKDHQGAELVITEQEENRESVYTCTVKNEVRSRKADFTLRDCFTAGAGIEVILPVVIMIVIIIILILLISLALFCYKKKTSRRSKREKMDPENGSPDATLPSRARLGHQVGSAADKIQINESDDTGEKELLLKDPGNEEEHDKNEKAEKKFESKIHLQGQDENEKGQSETVEIGNVTWTKGVKHRKEYFENLSIADNSGSNEKVPGEKTNKEESTQQTHQQNTGNTGSADATPPVNQEGSEDKMQDEDNGSDNTDVYKKRQKDPGNEEELDKNKNAVKAVKNTDTTQSFKGQDENLKGQSETENKTEEHLAKGKEIKHPTDDADNNENDGKEPGGIKEEGNKEETTEQTVQQTTGSPDAALPSRARLSHQEESAVDKIQDEDNGSDNTGEKKNLLKESGNEDAMKSKKHLQGQAEKKKGQSETGTKGVKHRKEYFENLSIADNSGSNDKVPVEKTNKEETTEQTHQQNTGNTGSPDATPSCLVTQEESEDKMENGKSGETNTEIENKKSFEGQDEKTKGQSGTPKKEDETGEHLAKEKYDADNNENDGKVPGEKKEGGNKEETTKQKNQQTTGSPDATPSCQGIQSAADKIQDKNNKSDNTGEKENLLKEPGNIEEELGKNENAVEAEKNIESKIHLQGQDEQEKGQSETGTKGVKHQIEKFESLSIADTSGTNGKVPGEKKQETNKEETTEQTHQQNTGYLQSPVQEISYQRSHDQEGKDKETIQKPERGEASPQGDDSTQCCRTTNEDEQTNNTKGDHKEMNVTNTEAASPQSVVIEGKKEDTDTKETLGNDQVNSENDQKPGEKREEGNYKADTDSPSKPEEDPVQNNSVSALSTNAEQNQGEAEDSRSVNSDDNEENVQTKAENNSNAVNEGTPKEKSEDDDNGQKEPKQDNDRSAGKDDNVNMNDDMSEQ